MLPRSLPDIVPKFPEDVYGPPPQNSFSPIPKGLHWLESPIIHPSCPYGSSMTDNVNEAYNNLAPRLHHFKVKQCTTLK